VAPDRSDSALTRWSTAHLERRLNESVRFRVDGSWRRYQRAVIAGSPLRVFRLTEAGCRVAAALEAGQAVTPSRLVDRLLDAGAIHPLVGTGFSETVSETVSENRFTIADVTIVTPQLGGSAAADGRVVVDDGSHPALVGAALRLPVNGGPAAARNAGRALVETSLVAFVDADVTLQTDWLDALLPHFHDDRVGLVAPRVIGESGSPLDLGVEPARIRAGTRVSYVPGAALVVRVAAFDGIGGFDEQMRFGEDVDLVWRLDEAGWICRFEPASTVSHEPRQSVRARMIQHEGYGTSAAPLALRHPKALAPIVSNGWTASVWALVALGHPVVACTIAVGSSAALIRKLPDLPPAASFGLAMRGHAGAAEQIGHALRREWWPLLAVGAVLSRRARWSAVAVAIIGARSLPTDLAYGWGVWRGMRRHRTLLPVIPRLLAWPPRSTRRHYGPSA
jgi:mycofactocin glycosyltransferase